MTRVILALLALGALSCRSRSTTMANEPWASDANFPAGADPWSGAPTKAAPSLAEIAAGHTPGVPVPAEVENWWKNRTDARLTAIETTKQVWQTITAHNYVDPAAKTFTLWTPTGYGIETTLDNVFYTEPCMIDLEPGDVITKLHVRTGGTVSGAAQDIVLTGPGLPAGPGVALNAGAALVANTNYEIVLGAPYTVPAGWFQANFTLFALSGAGLAGNSGNTFVGFAVTKRRTP